MTGVRTSLLRAALAGAAALTGLAVGAPSAGAHAVVSVDRGVLRIIDSDAVSKNTMSATPIAGNQVRFRDPTADGGVGLSGANAADRCAPVSEQEINCQLRDISAIRMDAGPLDDTVTYELPLTSQLVGGRGNDTISGAGGVDRAEGGDGNDRVFGRGGDDALGGGAGDDEVVGEDGNDLVQGGTGVDGVDGGAGDDDVRVRDGTADRIACGDGNDRVTADDLDPAGPDQGCETVVRAAPAAGDEDSVLPGPTPTRPADPSTERPLRVQVGGSTRQRARSGAVVVVASCTRAGTLSATGTVRVMGRTLRLTGTRKRVAVGGGGVQLRLRLPAAARRLARRRGARPVVRVVVTATASGRRARARMAAIRLS